MSESRDFEYWQPLLWCVLVLILIVALYEVMRLRFGSLRRAEGLNDPTPILGRRPFARDTHTTVRRRYASAQVEELTGTVPTAHESQQAYGILQGEVLRGRHEFPARHVVPDSLLRRGVMDVLRGGNDEQARILRVLFQTFNANNLVNIWDDVTTRIRNGAGNWFQSIGRNRAVQLRRGLDNVAGQLFLSERNGNLFAGTHIDTTGEAIALLGSNRVRDVVNAGVDLIESMGLRPQLALVQREVLLSYDGAMGEFRHYGYDPRRARDAQHDPLALTSWRRTATIWSNSNRTTLLWYSATYHPRMFFGALILLFVGLWMMINWTVVLRRYFS